MIYPKKRRCPECDGPCTRTVSVASPIVGGTVSCDLCDWTATFRQAYEIWCEMAVREARQKLRAKLDSDDRYQMAMWGARVRIMERRLCGKVLA